MSEKELRFKPLSEGLGFHPFSNGLPYTPANPPRDFSRGAGAVTAGRPSFQFPQPAVVTPVKTLPSIARPILAHPSLAPSGIPVKALSWDYVGRRFFAFIIDSAINLSLGLFVLVASLWSSLEVFASTNVLLITVAFLLFFNWALIAAQEVAVGTTIGKKIFGLRLAGGPVILLARSVAFIPSALCGLGVFWCALDSDHRGFHDLVSGIQPEES